MAFRHLSRTFLRCVQQTQLNQRLFSSISRRPLSFHQAATFLPIRRFSSVQTNDNAYRDLQTFLSKEIQLEKSSQKHPSKLPAIENFQVTTNGPEVTLTRQSGNEKVVVTFNVTNSVNANDFDPEADLTATEQGQQTNSPLKSRPSFQVDINRGGQTLSFLCSFLPNDYPQAPEQNAQQSQEDQSEDFQIDEFTIHDGEWTEKLYGSDCSVIDGDLYDKLLNILEEHGIGEEFANQLADYSTAYEHRQYIGLLEKLQEFVKK